MNLSNMLAIGIPLAALIVAAGPLFCLRSFRRAVLAGAGSGCIGIGAAVVGLMASGLAPVPGQAARARADDKQPEAEAKAPLASEAQPAEASDPVLGVQPATVEIPPGRPEWIGTEPDYSGTVHTVSVSSGPYALPQQAERALDEAIAKATNRYIAEQLDSELAPRLLSYDARRFKNDHQGPGKSKGKGKGKTKSKGHDKDHDKRESADRSARGPLVKETYHDVVHYSVGPMHENFALLEFGPEFRDEIARRWAQVRAASRLLQVGLFTLTTLLLISAVFGYFRLDNATRGYYTGRLQFMTAAAILTIVGAGVALARWITWL